MKKFASTLSKYLLILFPPLFFFSYFPIITLGANTYMNFELSLPEIWLVVFFISSLFNAKAVYKFYGIKKIALASLVPIYFSLSILWSENRPRAILTAGLFWLLVFAALGIIYYLKNDRSKRLRSSLIKSLLISATAISAFCWLQCILDIAGVPRDTTLLCRGCVASTFGFPHPSGFAIEPQFMGNLLLAPVLLCFYLLSKASSAPKSKNQALRRILLTLFLTTTLFLTLSRGAIYAFIVALIVMLLLIRKKSMLIKSSVCTAASLILALTAFGAFSVLGPTSDNFVSGVTKAVHQLTLGKIDLRPDEVKNSTVDTNVSITKDSETTQESVDPQPNTQPADQQTDPAHFSGYVEESTNVRLSLNSLAFRTWFSSPRYIIIGTGLGSAGPAMNRAFPAEIGPKEIVQNEYVSLLLETGLLGIVTILFVVIFTTVYLVKQKFLKNNPLFLCVLLGFALTLLFFSGLPNALHLYLFPLLLFNFNRRSENNFLVADVVENH